MTTLIAGKAAKFTVEVLADGDPIPVSGQVQATIFKMDGRTQLVEPFDLTETDGWATGLVEVELTTEQASKLSPGDAMLALIGAFGVRRYRLAIETLMSPTRTSLFIKDIVVGDIRREQLVAAAAGVLQDVKITDDYIWNKVRAAESEIAHRLRVPLVPTRFFANQPSQEQIDALDGMAWAIDPAYDYTPDMFMFEKWGYFVTRQRPINSVERMIFAYPSTTDGWMEIPKEWIRIDAKYGHIRLVPSSPAVFTTMNAFMMTALAGSRSIPFMIQLEYTAGLTDVETNYPELIDAIKKQAVVKIVSEAFLPQSGSINADGLSQSLSVDVAKYQDTIDHIIDGPDGSNGGLQSKINGIRALVM